MRRQLPAPLERFDRAYDRLGCFATMCLVVLVVAGLFVAVKVAGILTICAEFGRNAYFRDHVRFVPHRGFNVSNGHRLGAFYQVLFMALWTACLALWTTAAHLLVVGINEYFEKRRDDGLS